MVTHKEAKAAAGTLLEYCNERFKDCEANCTECMFQIHKRCALDLYLNKYGKSLQEEIAKMVEERYQELNGN